MEDNRKSLSPVTQALSALQQVLTVDQCDHIFVSFLKKQYILTCFSLVQPLINSAAASNGMSDEEIARQHQEQLYNESLMDIDPMDVDEPVPNVASSFNPHRVVEIDEDAALALRLQEEEYSRNSIIPSRPYRGQSNDKKSLSIITDSDDQLVVSDAELAAHLQAEENQRGQRRRPRPPLRLQPPLRPQRTTNQTFPSNEPEVIPMPDFVGPTRDRPSSRSNHDEFSSLIQFFASRGRGGQSRNNPRHGHRDIQSTDRDFGPNDYNVSDHSFDFI